MRSTNASSAKQRNNRFRKIGNVQENTIASLDFKILQTPGKKKSQKVAATRRNPFLFTLQSRLTIPATPCTKSGAAPL
jgi:hypothetical protein